VQTRLRVNLQTSPYQLLLLLLQHRGQVVTRKRSVRGSGRILSWLSTGALNKAVQKVRDCAWHSAEIPVYRNTAEASYRFLARWRGDSGPPCRRSGREPAYPRGLGRFPEGGSDGSGGRYRSRRSRPAGHLDLAASPGGPDLEL